MEGVDEIDALIIMFVAKRVGAVKDEIARLRLQAHGLQQ
jgi:hypothetical protein